MKNYFVKPTLVLAAIAGFTACNQNPYDSVGSGTITQTKPQQHDVVQPYTLEGDHSMTCNEGSACSLQLKGHVPSGNPVLTFTNLPDGAVYDPSTSMLTYTPGYDVVDVSKNPNATQAVFAVDVEIGSDAHSNVTGSDHFTITVNNVMRPMTVTLVSGATDISEGDALDQVVSVASPDFPQGPYYLALSGAPAGTTVTQDATTPSQFNIHFQAGADEVTVEDTNNNGVFQKQFAVTYNAMSLLGSTAVLQKNWTISDKRLAPLVTAPDALTSGSNVYFSIRADDLNDETAPEITVDTANVPFGTLAVTPLVETTSAGLSKYSTVVNVHWTGITADHMGTTTPIFFSVCVKSAKTLNALCTAKKTLITLSADKI